MGFSRPKPQVFFMCVYCPLVWTSSAWKLMSVNLVQGSHALLLRERKLLPSPVSAPRTSCTYFSC